MKITGTAEPRRSAQTSLIRRANECVSHEYSLSNAAVFSCTWAGGAQQYFVITGDVITGLPSDGNIISVKPLWKRSVVAQRGRGRRQTTLQGREALFNNISSNNVKPGWTLKSRLSVVDRDYLEITFLYTSLCDNVTKAELEETVSVCYMKRVA